MHGDEQGSRFWLGNLILGVALLILFFIGTLWEYMGVWALGLWVVVVVAGTYLIVTDKNDRPRNPH